MLVVTAAGIALGLVWAISAGLKLRSFNHFARDVGNVVPTYPRVVATLVVLIELTLAVLLLADVLRRSAAVISIGFLMILTASFIARARSTLTVDCACFGSRSSTDRDDSSTASGVLRDSLRLTGVFTRNAACLTLAAAAAGMVAAIPILIVAMWTLLVLASMVAIMGLRRQRHQVPHPDLTSLKRRRRKLFATYWHNGLWTSWLMCHANSANSSLH